MNNFSVAELSLKMEELVKTIELLKKENEEIKSILCSAKPIKVLYKDKGKEMGEWLRYYMTDDKQINRHIKKFGFDLDKHDGEIIGYAIMADPSEVLKK